MIEIGKTIAEYLKGQPFNNVMIVVLVSLMAADRYYSYMYVEPARRAAAKEAHETMHTVMADHDASNERNVDRLIGVMVGVRKEVKASHETFQQVADKIGADADKKSDE